MWEAFRAERELYCYCCSCHYCRWLMSLKERWALNFVTWDCRLSQPRDSSDSCPASHRISEPGTGWTVLEGRPAADRGPRAEAPRDVSLGSGFKESQLPADKITFSSGTVRVSCPPVPFPRQHTRSFLSWTLLLRCLIRVPPAKPSCRKQDGGCGELRAMKKELNICLGFSIETRSCPRSRFP